MDAPVNRSMPDDLIRLALETTTEGILGVDVQGSVTFANPSACRLLGYTADEMNGQIIEDLIHRESNGARQSIDESPCAQPIVSARPAVFTPMSSSARTAHVYLLNTARLP
jgi:PAS domain-containing protein